MVKRRRHHLLLACVLAMFVIFFYAISKQNQTRAAVEPNPKSDDDVWTAKFVYEPADHPSLNEALDATWQPVSGAHHKFFVYSAFYEARKEQHRMVRVIGAAATKQKPAELAWCVMQFASQPLVYSVRAKIKIIREHHNLFYSACFVFCPLADDQAPPVSVSIVTSLQAPPSNHIKVIDNVSNMSKEDRGNIAVCVKPVHSYSQELNLVEFLEMYSLLGAEHFTLYRHNVSSNIDCLMHSYVQRGVATWLSWELELQSGVEVRTQGMFTALNDCLYRNMYRYDNLVMVDLDEFILPRNGGDLAGLIR